MRRDEDAVRIGHMLDAAREAAALARGRNRGDLESDRLLGLALTRLLEVMGEAAGRVSMGTRSRLREIPWSQIIGLRNRLIRGHDSVDMDVLWAIVSQDLPRLIIILDGARMHIDGAQLDPGNRKGASGP